MGEGEKVERECEGHGIETLMTTQHIQYKLKII